MNIHLLWNLNSALLDPETSLTGLNHRRKLDFGTDLGSDSNSFKKLKKANNKEKIKKKIISFNVQIILSTKKANNNEKI